MSELVVVVIWDASERHLLIFVLYIQHLQNTFFLLKSDFCFSLSSKIQAVRYYDEHPDWSKDWERQTGFPLLARGLLSLAMFRLRSRRRRMTKTRIFYCTFFSKKN